MLTVLTICCACSLPELEALKGKLSAEGGGRFSAVFMTGSGSTIVCAGSDEPPEFLATDSDYADTFVRPARLITRVGDDWYAAPAGSK